VRASCCSATTVFLGLRKETSVADVFSVHRFDQAEGRHVRPLGAAVGDRRAYLEEPGFVKEFTDLYKLLP
jgi:hypothetical protein